MPTGKQRLIITDDDLVASPVIPASAPYPGAAPVGALPSVAGVKPPPLHVGATASPGTGGWRGTLPSSIIGAALATLAGWALSELVGQGDSGSLIVQSAMWVGAFGLLFGGIYSAWDDIAGGVWSRVPASGGIGLGIGLVGGLISGGIAQALYSEIVESILANVNSYDDLADAYSSVQFYFARGVAWGLFGLGVGAAAAAAKRSMRKLVNGLIGGAVGGTLGGLFFHWIGQQIESGALGRLLGMAFVGLAIGVAIGLVELARRQAWVRIVSGGMTGKEFIIYHQSTNVGASPKCEITLIKDPAIGAFHFRIDEQANRRSLQAFEGCAVAVNGVPVSQHWLRNGDVIQAGVTAIQYSDRAVAT